VQMRKRLRGTAVVVVMVVGCVVILGSVVGGVALSVIGNGRASGGGGLPASVSNNGGATLSPAVSGGPTPITTPSLIGPPGSSAPQSLGAHVVASTTNSRMESPLPRVSTTSPTPHPSGTCEPISPIPSPLPPGSPRPCDT
jgi:hypothetical protein